MKNLILILIYLTSAACCKAQNLASSSSGTIDYSKLPSEGCFIQNLNTYTIKNAIYYPSVNKFAFCSDPKVKYDVTPPYSKTSVTRICPDLVANYVQGEFKSETVIKGQHVNMNQYFTSDSTAVTFLTGQTQVKIIKDKQERDFAILVDVPTASIKKAAILTPNEQQQAMFNSPDYEFKRTKETAQISGFNCLKIITLDKKSGQSFDVWITNDIVIPDAAIPKEYRNIFGVPIKYRITQQGQVIDVTIKSITEKKVPSGMFSIPNHFDKISLDDLKSMRFGKQ